MVIKNFLNIKDHQNRITGSKVTAILVRGKMLPIGGVASGRVCARNLHSRLVLVLFDNFGDILVLLGTFGYFLVHLVTFL